ncbi:MAG: type II toxin-antitoxin system HigB family toxin, partial [bacterium]
VGMRLIGHRLLQEYALRHVDLRQSLADWIRETSAVHWHSPQAIKDRYATASFLAGSLVIFNLKGKRYRLAVRVDYAQGIASVEWIGTHAEYNRHRF